MDRQIAAAPPPAPSLLPETAAQSVAVPKLPELRDPPSEGEVYQILRRVADAYRTIASYQDQTTVIVEDSIKSLHQHSDETINADGTSRRTFTGTVRVVRPDKARIEFRLDGNSSLHAHWSQSPRGPLHSSSEGDENWSFNEACGYGVFCKGKQLWMTTETATRFASGGFNRGKQNPTTPPESAAIQFHPPTDPNERAGSLLHNSYGFDLPMDSHWLSCFFVSDPSAIFNGRVKNVALAGQEEIDGQTVDVLAWSEPVGQPRMQGPAVKNLAVPSRAWIRRDGLVVKMVHDLSAVYSYLRNPLGPSTIFSHLPPELYGDFKHVVTELHRDIKIGEAVPDTAFDCAFPGPERRSVR